MSRCKAGPFREAAWFGWHEIALDGDEHVFIATTDRAFREVVKGQYVEVDVERASPP